PLTIALTPSPSLLLVTLLPPPPCSTLFPYTTLFRSRALTTCKHTVSGSFHSPSGVLFTFPSRYWFTIGHQVVFRLGKWSSQFPTEFLVFRRTQDPDKARKVVTYRAITFCGEAFQLLLLTGLVLCFSPTTPPCMHVGLASSPFARRYLGN